MSQLTLIALDGSSVTLYLPLSSSFDKSLLEQNTQAFSGDFIWKVHVNKSKEYAQISGTVVDGVLEGYLNGYGYNDEQLMLVTETPYVNGYVHGLAKMYDIHDGSLMMRVHQAYGLYEGNGEFFYTDGTLAADLFFMKGYFHGRQLIYDAEGEIALDCVFDEGIAIEGSFLNDYDAFLRNFALKRKMTFEITHYEEGSAVSESTITLW
ncbi:MAG: hypothetical protein AAGF10_03045 [Verrucomicrobiota bacterium]